MNGDHLSCPHCGSNWLPKYGTSRGRQSYLCRNCHYKFTPGGNRSYYPESTKRQAAKMYCEGMNLSAIARALDVKKMTVYGWVKKAQQAARVSAVIKRERVAECPFKPVPKPAKVIFFDEMWTYVKVRHGDKRNSVWIWTAVEGKVKQVDKEHEGLLQE